MDYARGDVYLKKNKLFGSNIERDKSGISLIASGPSLNDFIITNVFPGSPADQAGLKPTTPLLDKLFFGIFQKFLETP